MEKDRLEIGIIEGTGLIRRGGGFILQNIGKTVAVITVVIAILVTFTDVSFSDLGTESFTSRALLMLLAGYLMYFSLEDAGEKLFEQSDEFKAAEATYRKAASAITAENIVGLREYVENYKTKEQSYRINSLLCARGVSKKEYQDYISGGKPKNRKAAKALRLAARIKPARISASDLISTTQRIKKSELQSPLGRKMPSLIFKLLPTSISTLITVSVMLSIKDGLTTRDLCDGIMKLSTLPIIGLRGYSNGYNYIKFSYLPWLETKTRLINGFLAGKAID